MKSVIAGRVAENWLWNGIGLHYCPTMYPLVSSGKKKVGYIKKTLVGVHVPHGATAADDWAPVFSICVHMCI